MKILDKIKETVSITFIPFLPENIGSMMFTVMVIGVIGFLFVSAVALSGCASVPVIDCALHSSSCN